MKKNYCINESYVSRESYTHYDDRRAKDESQREVYLKAAELWRANPSLQVVDFGCGSGWKLVNFFEGAKTIGFELPPNVQFLREKWPERDWRESQLGPTPVRLEGGILIVADVIEHLVDPDGLLDWIDSHSFDHIFISTPDRELVYREGHPGRRGPPRNPAHVREWNASEFAQYIGERFIIDEHIITNKSQGTQLIRGRRKAP
jgi:hypothetical protein